MENKPNQPNTGASNSSSASSANKSNAASGANRNTSASASTEGNNPTDTSQEAQQPTASKQPSASQAENQSSAAGEQQGGSSQRKSWLNQDELLKNVNQLPQSLKDLGAKAADQVNKLSSTQKIVGGALLVSGLSWLALRSKSSKGSAYTGSSAGSRYTPTGQSKWKSSSDSVYRGTTSSLNNDTDESGF